MGEVHRARDIKLHREVAMKVLPERGSRTAIAAPPARKPRLRRSVHGHMTSRLTADKCWPSPQGQRTESTCVPKFEWC
jgi:hypothetical protein